MVLAEAGLPVASNVCCTARELDRALAFLRTTGGPVVTKPARGTASGAGITLDIADGRALRRGFARARAYSSGILVEEQVEGQNVRITVLAGEVLGVVLRTPALVVGDGRHSVVELIRSKNGRLEAGEPGNRMLWPIRVDGELRRVLRMQSLTLDSVPRDGQDVPLRLVANSGQGGEIEDARSRVHDEYLRMAVEAADAVGAALCGVDLIIPDLESPPTGNGTVINELNTTPSLYIVNGLVDGVPSTYAAERVLEHLFDTR
jgi:cyanophycin synthetase